MKNRLIGRMVLLSGIVCASGCGLYQVTPCHKIPVSKTKAEPAAAPVVQKPAPIVPVEETVLKSKPITITGINFKTNSDQLVGKDISVLDEVVGFAKRHPESILHINGYCSKTGSYAYNYRLSLARARSVARYLEQRGVASDRLKVIGHSYDNPIASNATPAGRYANQRVEIASTIKIKTMTH